MHPTDDDRRQRYFDHVWSMLAMDGPSPRDPYASVFDDWGLDSIQVYQLVVITETFAGVDVPPPLLPEIYTAGDAYSYYCSLGDSSREPV